MYKMARSRAGAAALYRDEPAEPGMEEVEDYYDNPLEQDDYYSRQMGINTHTKSRLTRFRIHLLMVVALFIVIGVMATRVGEINTKDSESTSASSSTNNKKKPDMPRNPDLLSPEVSTNIIDSTVNGNFEPLATDLYEFLANLIGEDALIDEASVASTAFQWLDDDMRLSPYSYSKKQLRQRFSLATLYFGTSGMNENDKKWKNIDGWLSPISECDWYGVYCDPANEVIKLNLTGNGLHGDIPSEMSLLSKTLLVLDVSSNPITNSFQDLQFLSDLTKLKLLNIEDTFVASDGMPTYISGLTNLEVLDVANTLMNGPLDGSIFAKLTRLRYLDLSETTFNSTIPETLAKLPRLSALYAYKSGLRGKVGGFLPYMTNMFEMWLDDNYDLGGTIPSSIGTLTALASFSLANGDISGTIPSEIGKLTGMQQMWLYGNWLTGTVPSEIGRLTSLKIFAIEGNSIKNTVMPQEICQLDMVALSSDCGGENELMECACCTCCEAPCPIMNLPIYGDRLRL